ncbi:MAG: hypothetical protein QOI04_2381 [Verrucomicrobiota bacterium]
MNLRRLENITAILLSIVVLALLIVRVTHAGPLWRDECGALNLAQLPRLIDIARNFQHEAFPLLFPLTLRMFTGIFGGSDAALRCFGLLVGLLFLGAAWFNSRSAEDAPPLLVLSLLGLNASFLTWGSTVRGYGLGIVFLLLALAWTTRSFRNPTRANVIGALLGSLASVHCLVANVPLIGAMVISAVTVLVIRGRYRQALVVCGLAAIGAASFLPYLHSYFYADWNIVLKYPATFASLCRKLVLALGAPKFFVGAMWFAAVIGIPFIGWRLLSGPREKQTPEKDALTFLLILVPITLIAYCAFLRLLSYETQSWYYLAILGAVAGALDLMSTIVLRTQTLRIARLIFAATALIVLPFALWTRMTERQSNIDIVAQSIEHDATSRDLVIVNPWHFALSFQRYYRGNAHWITVPEIGAVRIHRYDLVKEKMQQVDPIADVRDALRETLQSGGRVWIVGGARPPQRDLPLRASPAPSVEFGWSHTIYTSIWSMQIGAFLQEHALEGDVRISPSAGVNEYENLTLITARGWKD